MLRQCTRTRLRSGCRLSLQEGGGLQDGGGGFGGAGAAGGMGRRR